MLNILKAHLSTQNASDMLNTLDFLTCKVTFYRGRKFYLDGYQGCITFNEIVGIASTKTPSAEAKEKLNKLHIIGEKEFKGANFIVRLMTRIRRIFASKAKKKREELLKQFGSQPISENTPATTIKTTPSMPAELKEIPVKDEPQKEPTQTQQEELKEKSKGVPAHNEPQGESPKTQQHELKENTKEVPAKDETQKGPIQTHVKKVKVSFALKSEDPGLFGSPKPLTDHDKALNQKYDEIRDYFKTQKKLIKEQLCQGTSLTPELLKINLCTVNTDAVTLRIRVPSLGVDSFGSFFESILVDADLPADEHIKRIAASAKDAFPLWTNAAQQAQAWLKQGKFKDWLMALPAWQQIAQHKLDVRLDKIELDRVNNEKSAGGWEAVCCFRFNCARKERNVLKEKLLAQLSPQNEAIYEWKTSNSPQTLRVKIPLGANQSGLTFEQAWAQQEDKLRRKAEKFLLVFSGIESPKLKPNFFDECFNGDFFGFAFNGSQEPKKPIEEYLKSLDEMMGCRLVERAQKKDYAQFKLEFKKIVKKGLLTLHPDKALAGLSPEEVKEKKAAVDAKFQKFLLAIKQAEEWIKTR